jgi:hypothetical protein
VKNGIVFSIKFPSGTSEQDKQLLRGVYFGRFTEMLVTHFSDEIQLVGISGAD